MFFSKYTLFGEKNVFIWKKIFVLENIFTEKTFIEKNINENVKNIYLIWKIYFYAENVCVANEI